MQVFFPYNGGYRCPNCELVLTARQVPHHKCTRAAAAPPLRACQHLGPELRRAPCATCSGSVQIKVFGCDLHGECAIGKSPQGVRSCTGCADYLPRQRPLPYAPAAAEFANHFQVDEGVPPFITHVQRAHDHQALIRQIPPEVTRVVGITRSGAAIASQISEMLHLPLSFCRHKLGDVIEAGHGFRFEGRIPAGEPNRSGPVLLVDDNVMTGNSFRECLPIVRNHFPGNDIVTAAVYVNRHATLKPDLVARELPWPVVLEWNLFNSILVESLAVDFDGILCPDCTAEQDDDGPRYVDWMQTVRPLYPMRRAPIPLIVTARLEKYRGLTLQWLAAHGMEVKELVMHPAATLAERQRDDIAAYKARHFQRFLAAPPNGLRPQMFVESDPFQAERIAHLTTGITVCPAAGRCFRGPFAQVL
jgi:orotate phosphoribosyltransferase